MALEINICPDINCDATYIRVTDKTGHGPTGWVAPNPLVGTITGAVIEVNLPNSTTYEPSDTADTITISTLGTLPSVEPDAYFDILNSMLGYTDGRLPDGAYKIRAVYDDGTNENTSDDTGTQWWLFDQNLQCDLQKFNSTIDWFKKEDAEKRDQFTDLVSRIASMWASWDCENKYEALERMIEIKKKLYKLLNCPC